MVANGVGASVRRKEDNRFITGQGRYTDDINVPGQAHAYILRSPLAHARINGIDAAEALNAPGVVAVFTGSDMAAAGVGGLPCGWLVHNKDGTPMAEPPHAPLCVDRVRHVGDQVAVVIAETLQQARDAAELVEVDYQDLPAITDASAALEDSAPQVWDDVSHNTCFDWELGDKAATDAAFDRADHVTTLELTNQRLVANPMEPRCYIANYEDAMGQYTLYTTSQNPHVIRLLMGANVLGIPEHKLRVIAPDVGGGFGSKIYHYAEEAIVTWASRQIKRPIKWTCERSEAFTSDAQGRDHKTKGELAIDSQGNFLALRVSTTANLGAYLSTFGSSVPTFLYATLLAGCYKTPAIYAEVKGVFTNTVPVDAYRGAGRPEASFLVERIVDKAARELDVSPVVLRQKNFIDKFPYQTPVAVEYDIGDYGATLDDALKIADYDGFESRRQEAQARGRRRGIGIACYIEACGIAPSQVAGALGARAGLFESGVVRVNPTGSVTVLTGAHSHGQGHETTFAQLVVETLGVDFDQVEVIHGDTGQVPFGMGTYGSRSLAVGGVALQNALNKVVDKAKKIAAHLMEASETDVEFEAGEFRVTGTDKTVAFGDVALAAYVPHNFPHETLEPGLEESAFYDPKNFTFPAGAHICEVEVDPETGVTEIVNYSVSDDFGRVINPLIVEGQVHGGLAQGIGQALMEHCVYDESSGQLLTGSFLDYCMPRADDFPFFNVSTQATPCTHNILGVKGCGEAGTIGSPPAVINAIVDALAPIGVNEIDMPATPHRVWQAISSANQ